MPLHRWLNNHDMIMSFWKACIDFPGYTLLISERMEWPKTFNELTDFFFKSHYNKQLLLWKLWNASIKDFLFVDLPKKLNSLTSGYRQVPSWRVNSSITIHDETKSRIFCWQKSRTSPKLSVPNEKDTTIDTLSTIDKTMAKLNQTTRYP